MQKYNFLYFLDVEICLLILIAKSYILNLCDFRWDNYLHADLFRIVMEVFLSTQRMCVWSDSDVGPHRVKAISTGLPRLPVASLRFFLEILNNFAGNLGIFRGNLGKISRKSWENIWEILGIMIRFRLGWELRTLCPYMVGGGGSLLAKIV